jgi:hypothetical protein
MIFQVEVTPVFLVKDVSRCLSIVDVSTQESVHLIVADYKCDPQPDPSPIPQITLDQIRAIRHVLHSWYLSSPIIHITAEHIPILLVAADNAVTMAQGQKHTRRNCHKGPHREKWVEAESV